MRARKGNRSEPPGFDWGFDCCRVPFATLLVLFVFHSSVHTQTADQLYGKLKIAATIFPLADIAKQISVSGPSGRRPGGEKSEVITILPAGANPHTFELTP